MFRIVVLSLFPLSFPASADDITESSPAGLEERDESAVRATIRDEDEVNNTMSAANRIYNDDTTYGKIGYSGDVDWFKIMFTFSGQANFWLGDIPYGKDFELHLYNASGRLLASSTSNNSSSQQKFIGSQFVTANSWYYIKVSGYNCYDTTNYYQFRIRCYLVRDVEILYDTTTTYTKTVAEMNTAFDNATAAFASEFGIRFNRESTDAWSGLNGSSCPNTSNDSICNSNCGSNVNCGVIHHKSASRLLNIPYSTATTSTHTCRIVGHRICFYDVDDDPTTPHHREAYGMAHSYGETAIGLHSVVTTKSVNFKRTIQHELTHNLANEHGYCTPGQLCVLEGDMDEWCDYCTSIINSRR